MSRSCFDVIDPEPLPLNPPLRKLPNVHICRNITVSIGDEVGHLAAPIFEESEHWRVGKPPRYSVSLSCIALSA